MNKSIMNYVAVGAYALGLFGLNSCLKVDDTYDLDKDIDMTITVGGDLTLPGSSTERMLLGDLLELEDDGIVKTNETTGDYALVQKGESTSTNINVEKVEIESNTGFNGFNKNVPVNNQGSEIQSNFSAEIAINISRSEIPNELLRIENAQTTMPGTNIALRQTTGNSVKLVKGYRIIFPECMTVEYKGMDNAWKANGNQLILEADEGFTIDNSSNIPFEITKIDFVNKEAEEGITEGAIFYYNSHKIALNGNVQFDGDILVSGNGNAGKISGNVESNIISLESVSGTIKPETNNNKIEIGELPDFLNGDDVTIDVTDPRIYLTVSNPTDAQITMDAKLIPTRGEENGEKVYINSLTVPANQENYKICIHQNRNFQVDGHEVIVDNLSSLIEKIPDVIDFEIQKIAASGNGIALGEDISINTDYELNTPLMFGSKTNIKYVKTIDGWNTDLEDAEFELVEASMIIENAIPLGLNLVAKAIDKDGKPLKNGVKVDMNIDVESGTIDNPTKKEVKFSISSDNGNVKGLDGIEMTITAKAGKNTAETALNEKQTLKLDEIRLRVKGGVTMDLN